MIILSTLRILKKSCFFPQYIKSVLITGRQKLFQPIFSCKRNFRSMAEGDKNYVLCSEINCDGGIRLCKYKSNISGITVCIAELDGPTVAGYLCLATEAHDDDGLPHTLEHLTFLGSEHYPYKGVLDQIANRCLASGTNAWTDTDHTCYTMRTAGSEGFLKLLPIYMDHILYPTLTESAYLTEVHHINGEGEDAGIVYCEMQAKENSGEYRCYRSMLRHMYPGHCGYKSETGGLIKNLRESTSNEKVKAYHKEFYRPENLCIIIAGQIEADKVFTALSAVEDRILNEVKQEPFVRPWTSPVPPMENSADLTIDYPCDEDEYGIALIAWRGPLAKETYDFLSLQLLFDYLTDTSVSPLSREFVEIEDPFCNTVDSSMIENSVSCIYLHFSNVPIKKLTEVKEKLFEVLKNIADGTEPIDMERMRTIIRKRKLYILSNMESDPSEHFAMCVIGNFLYGSAESDLKDRLCEMPILDKLCTESMEHWVQILNSYIINKKCVTVLGRPSPSLSNELAQLEKDRIKKQRESLGPENLKEKAQILKDAVMNNEIPVPKDLVLSIAIPSFKSIKFHPVKRICNAVPTKHKEIDFPIENMPCRFQLDDLRTNFVRVTVIMDTSSLSKDLRMYLPLFVELLDECAVNRNGEIISHKEVIKQLAEDTICIAASIGQNYSRFFCGRFSQVVCFYLLVEEEKYLKSVQWIHEILYHIVFEPKRVQTSVKKMIADAASKKRSSGCIARTIIKNLCFTPESNQWTSSLLRQQVFLTSLQKKLESNPDEVVGMLNKVRENITKANKMTVHLSINYENLKKKVDPDTVWTKSLLPSTEPPAIRNCSTKLCHEYMQPFTEDALKAVITSVGSVDSTSVLVTAPCINSYLDPDYPALLVFIQYITQSEGPMFKKIRGKGLAYGYSIYCNPCQGLVFFTLSKTTHPVDAYQETRDIVESLVNSSAEWDNTLLESCISSLVFELIENIKTVDLISEESLGAYLKNIDFTFYESILDKISHITTADMERVGSLYFRPLFDPNCSKIAICCNPAKIDDIVDGFKKFSRNFTVVPTLEESFMSKM